jgi:hypothetical protein
LCHDAAINTIDADSVKSRVMHFGAGASLARALTVVHDFDG